MEQTVSKCDIRMIHCYTKGQVTTKYYRFLTKDGGWIWMQSYATVVHNTRSSRPHCIVSVNYVLSKQEAESLQLEVEQVRKPEPLYSSSISTTQGSTTNGTTTSTPTRTRHQKAKSRKSPYLYEDANLGCLVTLWTLPLRNELLSTTPRSLFSRCPHPLLRARGTESPHSAHILPTWPWVSWTREVETSFPHYPPQGSRHCLTWKPDTTEKRDILCRALLPSPPCEASVMSSSPDVETDPMQPMPCVMPPQQELCSAAIGYVPPAAPRPTRWASTTTFCTPPLRATADPSAVHRTPCSPNPTSTASRTDGRTPPRSTSSTSSPAPQHSNSKSTTSALGPVLRGGGSNNHYKSVITATNLQRAAGLHQPEIDEQAAAVSATNLRQLFADGQFVQRLVLLRGGEATAAAASGLRHQVCAVQVTTFGQVLPTVYLPPM
ncbi:single-minded homolog 1 [Caerostris extrusa]|uniref:Single-minded homolog 1 n=1 Tax=Caerostris extrusa TaxID=172846 RepID=A0AAV4THB9_CAEEX|nr:single-minded homolog 1 [Caerostris extrusa]